MALSGEAWERTAAVTGGLLPESVRVAASPLTLHCLVWGRSSDPTALLIHGNGAHAHWFDALVPALVPGWRLVVPDLRGHGESDWAEPPRYRMEDFAGDVSAILDRLAPGPVVLVGHSMGGRIATWYTAEHPGRIRGLVVIDSRMSVVAPETAAAWRAQVVGKREGRGYPSRETAVAAFRFVPEEGGVAPAVVADLAHHAIRERAPGDWTYRFDRAVLSLEGDGAGDLLARLGTVACPLFIMAGQDSWVMDGAQRGEIMGLVPRARVEISPGGHHFLVAHPVPVGAALRGFLDELA